MGLRLVAAMACCASTVDGLDNGLGLRPPQGWRSWNAYGTAITQEIILEAAKVMAAPRSLPGSKRNSSFKALGFTYVGIDEGWAKCHAGVNGSFHRLDGSPIVDTAKFPSLQQLTGDIHKLGLRAGWYAACDGCTERSWVGEANIARHMRATVQAVVDYGFDSLKLDSGSEFNNLTWWADLLNATGRHILIENCHQGRTTPGAVVGPNQEKPLPGNNQSNAPCTGLGGAVSNCPYNVYRTSHDIEPSWASMLNNLNSTRPYLADPPLSRPGAWAYPDMLEVGRMPSFEEDRTMFGAWVIVSSPLILGHDVTNETQNERVWAVVGNAEAIAINQAWHGNSLHWPDRHPGRFIRTIHPLLTDPIHPTNGSQMWAKPLSATSHAVFIFSDGPPGSKLFATIDLAADLGIPASAAAGAEVRDVWQGIDLAKVGADGRYTTAGLASHDSALLVFTWE